VNEISQGGGSPELDRANQMIVELRERLKKLEEKQVPSCSSFNAEGGSKDDIMISMDDVGVALDTSQMTNT
jgi:hypothetical protein